MKNYNPIEKVKLFFKDKVDLELVIVNESLKNKLSEA
jgi:hypothetical protein